MGNMEGGMKPNYKYRYKDWAIGSWEPVYVDIENDCFYREHLGKFTKNSTKWSSLLKCEDSEIMKIDSSDVVNKPLHYNTGGSIECIDYIEDFLSYKEYRGYLRGNIGKYLHRFTYKNGLEDLKKARWYLNRLIQLEEGQIGKD